jgi:hypothetical protein
MSWSAHRVWTRDMEKVVQDRVQTVLRSRKLSRVMDRFGSDVFRRSSIFHGLDEFLSEQNIKGGVCFEIGTWNGLTSVVLSQYFDRVVTVDIAHNELKHDIIDYLGIKNIRCFDIKDNGDKRKVVKEFCPNFDFAYMDGNHADDTAEDWKLVNGCGRVLFHEFWPFQSPVWDLVNSLPPNEVAHNGEGLALWVKA